MTERAALPVGSVERALVLGRIEDCRGRHVPQRSVPPRVYFAFSPSPLPCSNRVFPTLVQCYDDMALFPKRLTCFCCGRRPTLTARGPVRKFHCDHCEADNYLDEVRSLEMTVDKND